MTYQLPEPAMKELNPYAGEVYDPYPGKTHLNWFTPDQMQAAYAAGVAAAREVLAAENAVLREAAQQALEALDNVAGKGKLCNAAIAALSATLTQEKTQ